MNEIATKIILDPPKADVVLVFSASWFVWAFLFALVIGLVLAFATKEKDAA